MGGGSKMTAIADPVGYAAIETVAKKQQEIERQDEIMKRLQSGDHPLLNDTEDTLS